jgi:hypothetical protein
MWHSCKEAELTLQTVLSPWRITLFSICNNVGVLKRIGNFVALLVRGKPSLE